MLDRIKKLDLRNVNWKKLDYPKIALTAVFLLAMFRCHIVHLFGKSLLIGNGGHIRMMVSMISHRVQILCMRGRSV